MGLYVAVGLFVLGSLIWMGTRRRALAVSAAGMGVSMLFASYASARWGDELIMRMSFGADDWTSLQHELQAREADLARYCRENAGLTTSQLVEGYIATDRSLPWFHFAEPNIPPLSFKISDWRDTVPRIVVSFGCSNNVLFNSKTMAVESSD
jgi:hypothetical protein